MKGYQRTDKWTVCWCMRECDTLWLDVVNSDSRCTDKEIVIVEFGFNDDIASQKTGRHHLTLGCRFDDGLPSVCWAWDDESKVKEPFLETIPFEEDFLFKTELLHLLVRREVDLARYGLAFQDLFGDAGLMLLLWLWQVLIPLPQDFPRFPISQIHPVQFKTIQNIHNLGTHFDLREMVFLLQFPCFSVFPFNISELQ